MASDPPLLTVYSRAGCHLCEQMLDELEGYREAVAFRLDVVDVDGDEGLRQRYGSDVPVLMGGDGEEICRHFFNYAAVNAYLDNIR